MNRLIVTFTSASLVVAGLCGCQAAPPAADPEQKPTQEQTSNNGNAAILQEEFEGGDTGQLSPVEGAPDTREEAPQEDSQ